MILPLLLAASLTALPALPAEPVLKAVCAPDAPLFPTWPQSPTAAEVLSGPDLGLVQVVSVDEKDEMHFAYGGMSSGTFRVRIIMAFRGLHPFESIAIPYDWDWADDRGAEGFLPQVGHLYLYRGYDPSDESWIDITDAACTPMTGPS